MALSMIGTILGFNYGSAIWDEILRTGSNEDENQEIIFLSRVFPSDLEILRDIWNISVEIKAAFYIANIAAPLLVMYKFKPCETIYTCWINCYSRDRSSPLPQLSEQKELHFSLHDCSSLPERIISVTNKVDWGNLIRISQEIPPWSSQQYDIIKGNIQQCQVELWQKV